MEWKELLGEATEYDKKQAVERKKPKSWLKSISAFANTSGGTLIFGISNEEEVVGLSDIRSDSEYISQKLKERIYPFPEVVMKLYKTEDEKIYSLCMSRKELKLPIITVRTVLQRHISELEMRA